MKRKYTKRNSPICRHCDKETENLLVDGTNKQGKKYFSCRKCNTERARKYRMTKTGRAAIYRAVYKSIDKYRVKQNARVYLNNHIKMGLVQRPNECKCGNNKVEAHHENYSKPLEVLWLCRECHANLHRRLSLSMV